MNRRDFLSFSSVSETSSAPMMPTRSLAGDLTPYSGPWDRAAAAHLLRRCCFGPTPEEINQALNWGLEQTLDRLLGNHQLPAPPVMFDFNEDRNAREGQTWIEAPLDDGGDDGRRRRSLRAWNIGLMVGEGIRIRESMVLFWHNHFSVEIGKVGEARNAYQYLDLLRKNALGNFKTLVEEMTILPAMLRYLDGDDNRKGRPNENYARELFELFSIGKGPLRGPGDYTYYNENDVLAAAECLTGWRPITQGDDAGSPQVEFSEDRHEPGDKQFSAAFQNRVISNAGKDEYKVLIDMIFAEKQTAVHIVKKLYRWFVYYDITEEVMRDIIEPLAQQMVDENYEVKNVIRRLLASEHFLGTDSHGAYIKHPLDMVVGVVKNSRYPVPTETDYIWSYYFWDNMLNQARNMQMEFMNPPDVAGWKAFYQEPLFHQIWINSVTLPYRFSYLKNFVRNGYRKNDIRIEMDLIELLGTVEDPFDPNLLISGWTERFLPMPLDQVQLDALKNVLIPGLPDFEWTEEYMLYLADPSDEMVSKSILTKLEALLTAIVTMAEFQLS
ncbi:MAG: DUF1800 domain-containing protein [Bacteroidota bacterium]